MTGGVHVNIRDDLFICFNTEGVDLPEPQKNYSVSQLSFEVRLSNFKKIISLIEEAGNYATNQSDLSIDALKAFTQTLVDANNATKMLTIY
jgi:hypothetical protein